MARRAIGSDFESMPEEELLPVETPPPWERPGLSTAYAETGRQALSIIGDVLRTRGRSTLIVPGYLCESMIVPFRNGGWRIRSIPLDEDLRYPSDFASFLERSLDGAVLLLASYFGRRPDASHAAMASEARERGAVIIEDETHRLLQPGGTDADFSFASLRKVLPVADGAYVQGDAEILDRISALAEDDSGRWAAMDAKRSAIDGTGDIDHRSLFVAANEVLEEDGRLLRATSRTRTTVQVLPYESMAATRRENAAVLRQLLDRAGLPTLSLGPDDVPSHLVVRVSAPHDLQRRLASSNIFTSIHWPEVTAIGSDRPWRDDLLSIPVDHRYGIDDMQRIGALLVEETAK